MSYVRWSSDNFWSDVYTYAHVDGSWTTHVAGSRYDGTPPDDILPLIGKLPKEEIAELYRKRGEWFDAAQQVPIGLAEDGKTFKDPDPGACADTLERLRGLGYHVPQYAIDALREEQAEMTVTNGE